MRRVATFGMNINSPLKGNSFALPFFHKRRNNSNNSDATLDDDAVMRIPILDKIPDTIRNHFVATTGEFVGTCLFLLLALSGAQVANTVPTSAGLTFADIGPNAQQLQYIALSFGFSLAVNAWVFFRISGGLFNPAVTFGMCVIGALPWFRGVLLFGSQILGGIVASALVQCMFPGALNAETALGGQTSVVQGLFIEMFLTAQLVFTIFMLAAEKHKATFIAPVGIGLSLFVAELTGVYFTGGSLNPARSFGPAVVNLSFPSYHWIYWVGPVLGSVMAAGFYKFIKILEYENANPNQDASRAKQQQRQREKALLMAAGINEVEADQVASRLSEVVREPRQGDVARTGTESSEKTVVGEHARYGGLDGKVMAGEQVPSTPKGEHREVMYGDPFGSGSSGSSGAGRTFVEQSPGRTLVEQSPGRTLVEQSPRDKRMSDGYSYHC